MSDPKKVIKFKVKAMVNRKKGKVLFAQVDSAFVDVLLSFLTLPLGTFAKIFKRLPFGTLSTLHTALENLDADHFWKEGAKSILLRPRSSSDAEIKKLKLNFTESSSLEYFVCSKKCRSEARFQSLSVFYDSLGACKYCNSPMEREAVAAKTQIQSDEDGVFVKETTSFLITDDLRIMPNAGLLQIVKFLGITDMDEAVPMNATFGFNEVVMLLMRSLISVNPLSFVLLKGRLEANKEIEFTTNASNSNSNSKTMNLKLVVQKSNNKLLYAEAGEDFVEFLFSFLVIPLGGVESLLSRNSNVKPIDNLCKSVEDLIPDKYFNNLEAKNRVLKPRIPHGYVSKDHIFSLTEDELPALYGDGRFQAASTNFPEGQGSYLKGPRTFKVADDLTVTPFCFVSILSSLSEKKILISDVKEVELEIGLKEGLSILKASLTSKCALTDVLLSQVMTKKPKTEQV